MMEPQSSDDRRLVMISVDYQGEWSGFYGDGDDETFWRGFGSGSIIIRRTDDEKWTVCASAAKKDDGDGTMSIKITTLSGKILAASRTTRVHGQVIIGWGID